AIRFCNHPPPLFLVGQPNCRYLNCRQVITGVSYACRRVFSCATRIGHQFTPPLWVTLCVTVTTASSIPLTALIDGQFCSTRNCSWKYNEYRKYCCRHWAGPRF